MGERRDTTPPILFAPVHGGRIAYQDFGTGPGTIVAMPPLAQNIEMAWEWPDVRRMFDRFSTFTRFIHFDKRGTGASDRTGRLDSIDERVDDLRAVMDAAGVERAHIFGGSEGGPVAALFAATYPDRVEGLILSGTGATLYPADMTPEERQAAFDRIDVACRLWGTPDSPVVDRFAPSLASDPEYRTWHQRYERAAASQDSIRSILQSSVDVDVRDILPDITAPALVMRRVGEAAFTEAQTRQFADGIPDATYVELEGDDHFAYAGDMETWMGHIERFVVGYVDQGSRPIGTQTKPRITTLGGFSVEVDGEPVPTSAWGSRHARQLCKRLVAARGWPVTRDQLIDMLWPDDTDRDTVSARLSVQLSKLRRVLQGGVVADRETVRLDLDEVDTDLEAFYRAEDDTAIVAAYRGEFLPEDIYDDWTNPPRDEARTRFRTAARRLSVHASGTGDHPRAVSTARRLVEVDAFDDDAHRILVEALVAAGELREAERAHETWTTTMAEIDIAVPPLTTFT